MKILILFMCVFLVGCTMTATKDKDRVVLKGFGSGKAEFPDGTKIEKGLIKIPDLNIDN